MWKHSDSGVEMRGREKAGRSSGGNSNSPVVSGSGGGGGEGEERSVWTLGQDRATALLMDWMWERERNHEDSKLCTWPSSWKAELSLAGLWRLERVEVESLGWGCLLGHQGDGAARRAEARAGG